MDVPEYFLPPGRDLTSALAAVDGLASSYSAKAREGHRTRARQGAFLFSLAECGLLGARGPEDLRAATHTAVESLLLFAADFDGFDDFGDALGDAGRLVVHGLRARARAEGFSAAREGQLPAPARPCGSDGDASAAGSELLACAAELAEAVAAWAPADAKLGAKMRLALAEVKGDLGLHEEALQLGKEAEEGFRRQGDQLGLGLCELLCAQLHFKGRHFHLCLRSAESAYDFLAAFGHARARAKLLAACALRMQRRHFRALQAAKEALPLAQEFGDLRMQASLLFLLGSALQQKGGRGRESAAAAQEAATLFLEFQDACGWAEMSLLVALRALCAEGAQDSAQDMLLTHMRRAPALGPKLLVRQLWVELLQKSEELELQKTRAIADKTLTALRRQGNAEWLAREIQLISGLHLKLNTRKQVEEARKWAEQAREILQEAKEEYLEAKSVPFVATCCIYLGEDTKAAELLTARRRQLAVLRARGDEAEAALQLADVLAKQQVSRVDSRARRFLRDSLQIAHEALYAFDDMGDEMGAAKARLLLCEIYMYRQEPEEAESEAKLAVKIYQAAGEAQLLAKAVRKLGTASCERDRPEDAAKQASEAVIFCRKAGDRYAVADMLSWEAQMHSQVVAKQIEGLEESAAQKIVFRNLSKVMTPVKEAILLARKLQDKGLIASTLCAVGEVEASVGKWDAALCACAEAAQLARKRNERATESRALVLSSELHFRKKDVILAKEEAERAWHLARRSFLWDLRKSAERAMRRVGSQITPPGVALLSSAAFCEGPRPNIARSSLARAAAAKSTAQEPWKPLVFKMPQKKQPRKLEPGEDDFTLKMRDRLRSLKVKEDDQPDDLVTVSTENAKNLALSAMWYIDQQAAKEKRERDHPDVQVLRQRYDGALERLEGEEDAARPSAERHGHLEIPGALDMDELYHRASVKRVERPVKDVKAGLLGFVKSE
ncbi:unnamed protein product [Effrenium voratum]|uniref:Uncharacterized protein n=1 Tax=Effrenium voratum TaxID=2562239 RepID=A0AA36I908_9DINO|nr:unnamed protein product [Effrenium voratum]